MTSLFNKAAEEDENVTEETSQSRCQTESRDRA